MLNLGVRKYQNKYDVLTKVSTRKHFSEYTYLLRRVRRTDIDFEGVVEKPFRAILLHSPGRKPWVIIVNTFIEPQRGGTTEQIKSNVRVIVPLLRSS